MMADDQVDDITDVLNECMDDIREAATKFPAEVSIVALAAQIGEHAINATRGDERLAWALINDAIEQTRDNIRRGADAFAAARIAGLN